MKIELHDVALAYGNGTRLLSNISLVVEAGAFVLIEGPSGSGKSSLLRLLNRLQEPTVGKILIDGAPILGLDVTELRRKIGYVQQTPIMLGGSVADNLHLSFRFRASRKQPPPDRERLRRWMDDFLLRDVDLTSDAMTLSVGQKQRIALIRSLLTEPEVLLCDEPTSALDSESRQIVQSSLEHLNVERNMSVVAVTHLDFRPGRVSAQRYHLSKEQGLRNATT